MVGRIIVGIGIGVASLTTPIYLAEVAVPHMRGRLVTINALLVTLGQFIAGMIDGIFDEYFPLEGWRYMLGLAAVPSLTMLVGFMYLPESPRWLAMNGKRERSLEVLQSLRDSDQEALEEWEEIVNALPVDAIVEDGSSECGSYDGHDGDVTVEKADHSFRIQVTVMISDAPTRSALFLGCGLMALQQLSGINTVMYYAASIYQMSGFDGKPPPLSMDAIDYVVFAYSVYILVSSRNNIRLVEWLYGSCTSDWYRL
jgi:SP family myo-inositol transporter-like MFS transporter 13